jgi:hypothetical protein
MNYERVMCNYIGRRLQNGRVRVYKVSTVCYALDDELIGPSLNPRFDLYNHSPTGFEWGYCGSGPAQLALAICADYLQDDKLALKVYQYFKDKVIAAQPKQGFVLSGAYVDEMIQEIIKGFKEN